MTNDRHPVGSEPSYCRSALCFAASSSYPRLHRIRNIQRPGGFMYWTCEWWINNLWKSGCDRQPIFSMARSSFSLLPTVNTCPSSFCSSIRCFIEYFIDGLLSVASPISYKKLQFNGQKHYFCHLTSNEASSSEIRRVYERPGFKCKIVNGFFFDLLRWRRFSATFFVLSFFSLIWSLL